MKKTKQRAKTLNKSIILSAVPFMTGFLGATIVQEVVFEPKKHKDNAPCDVCFTQKDATKRTKWRKEDDNNEYFSSFDMKVGIGDV